MDNSDSWIDVRFFSNDEPVDHCEYNYATPEDIMTELGRFTPKRGFGSYERVECWFTANLAATPYHRQWTLVID